MRLSLILFFLTLAAPVCAQWYSGGNLAGGQRQGTLAVWTGHDWNFGKAKKWGMGAGLRATAYLGNNHSYLTAPAKLTSGSTGPLVIFRDNIEANLDTLQLPTPRVVAVNVFVQLHYHLSSRITVGFNIDAIGFTLGRPTRGTYLNFPQGTATPATPTRFNLLLISDNDLGSLNSELFVRYRWKGQWAVQAGVQFLFTEYTTSTPVQQFPEPNDRFRNKSLMGAAGVVYRFL